MDRKHLAAPELPQIFVQSALQFASHQAWAEALSMLAA